jgi:hypothetical protein
MNPEDVNPARIIGRASAETQALIKFLESAEVGKIITYREMEEACKIDLQTHPGPLLTARRSLVKNKRMAFGTVRGIGIRLLDDEEVTETGAGTIKKIRRAAHRGVNTLNCANLEKVTPEGKVRLITSKTVLSFMHHAGGRKTLNIAEQAVRISNGEMKIGDVSTLFKNPP